METTFVTLDGPANALALSPDDSQVVVAGQHVFKVFDIEGNKLTERANLWAGRSESSKCWNDVVWNPIDDSLIATADTNMKVVTWNINRSGQSQCIAVYREHDRAVNKVRFHMADVNLLISASQDFQMKLFDLRKKESSSTFISDAGSVRDVHFSPHYSEKFCAVTENGAVQLWDRRRPDRVERQVTENSEPVYTLDWHPTTPLWVATAGRDYSIKVWDFTDSTSPVLRNTVNTLAAVKMVKWKLEGKKYHIASCAQVKDGSISVWDIRRPYIPLATLSEYRCLTNAFAWHTGLNSLLSVNIDSKLCLIPYENASRPTDDLNPVAFDVSIQGCIAHAIPTKRETESKRHVSKQLIMSRKTFSAGEITGPILSVLNLMEFRDADNPLSVHDLVKSARQYKLSGRSLAEICEHNASVARRLGRPQVALTWQIVQILYSGDGPNTDHAQGFTGSSWEDTRPVPESGFDADHKSTRHHSGEANESNAVGANTDEYDSDTDDPDDDYRWADYGSGLVTDSDFISDYGVMDLHYVGPLNVIDENQDWRLPVEAFQPIDENLLRPSTLQDLPTSNVEERESKETVGVPVETAALLSDVKNISEPAWNSSSLVVDMLHHYADSGDVQMAVTLVVVLGARLKGLLDDSVLEHWFLAYIDLLHQLQLWNTATEVIHHADGLPEVQQIIEQSTTFTVSCGNGHTQLRASSMCRQCSSVPSRCSLCHQVVQGLYVWCQGCSHGGHLYHMKEWFQNQRECPTGCGHWCEYT